MDDVLETIGHLPVAREGKAEFRPVQIPPGSRDLIVDQILGGPRLCIHLSHEEVETIETDGRKIA